MKTYRWLFFLAIVTAIAGCRSGVYSAAEVTAIIGDTNVVAIGVDQATRVYRTNSSGKRIAGLVLDGVDKIGGIESLESGKTVLTFRDPVLKGFIRGRIEQAKEAFSSGGKTDFFFSYEEADVFKPKGTNVFSKSEVKFGFLRLNVAQKQ